MRGTHSFGIVAAIAVLAYSWQGGNTEPAPAADAADRRLEARLSPRSSAQPDDPEAEPRDAPLVRDFVSNAKAGPEAPELPAWLSRAVPGIDSSEAEYTTNDRSRDEPLRSVALNYIHLNVLHDIIDLNGLDEESAAYDYDDGDGTLSPTELGFQVWRNGQLVSLTLGPDPYSSFGYGVNELPETLADFDQLEHLDVQGNFISRLPDSIGELRALKVLRAQSNELVELPDSIGRLEGLRELVLSGNQLPTLPGAIEDLPNLERLFVADNPLESLSEGLGDLYSLRVLGLTRSAEGPTSDGGLTDLPDSLTYLPNLESLYVAGNKLCASATVAFLVADDSVEVFGMSSQSCSGTTGP